MKRVLVTGGAGLVGSHLVALLVSQGREVVVLDDLSSGKKEFLPPKAGYLRLVLGDIRNADLVRQTFKEFRPTAVFHLAAMHYIPRCEAQPQDAVSINIGGTLSILQACEAVPPERVIFASTGAVYGPKDTPHVESEIPSPLDIYGITKYAGELLVGYFGRKTSIPCVVARLFNVFGPHETNPHLIPEIVAQLRAERTTIELGNLDPRRDYVHVKDVAKALLALGILDADTYGVFNVGTGKAYSVREVVECLASLWTEPISVVQTASKKRAVDRPYLSADISRIHAATGWSPTIDLETGLRQLVLS